MCVCVFACVCLRACVCLCVCVCECVVCVADEAEVHGVDGSFTGEVLQAPGLPTDPDKASQCQAPASVRGVVESPCGG